MKLGLKSNEVKLVPYTEEWTNEFQKVKQEIIKATGIDDSSIEHIGSTAIQGMVAKPLLDMVVGVDDLDKLEDSTIKGLKTIGFLRLRVERPNEIIFAKFIDETYVEKTHYIHVVGFESDLWKNLLFFRDYLNSNDKEREEYRRLKEEYVKVGKSDIQEYTDYKESFVKGIYGRRTAR